MFYDTFIGDGNSLGYREFYNINVRDPTKLIEKEEDTGHAIKKITEHFLWQGIVRDYKCDRITSITLIFGHVKTA